MGVGGGGGDECRAAGDHVSSCVTMCTVISLKSIVKYIAVLSFVPNDGMECCGEMRF